MTLPARTENTHAYTLPRLASAAVVLGLSLLVRGAVFSIRYHQSLQIEALGGVGLTAFGGSDVPGWLGMTQYFIEQGGLAYGLMGTRPPLFPLTVALVYILGGSALHGAALQTVFGAVTPVIGYLLAHNLLVRSARLERPERLALVAGGVMALDPASVAASTSLLSEPLFNLAFTACILHLTLFTERPRWLHALFASLWLGAAMLTRPTAIYFWVIAPLMLAPLVRRWWRPAIGLIGVGLAVYLGWSARNLRYQGVFTYSMQTNFSLLFLRAVSAEHMATGRPVDDLYVEYVRELYASVGDTEAANQVEPWMFWNFLPAPSSELYARMGEMAREKLLQYWPYALASTPIGIWRMFGVTLAFPGWFAPFELVYHALLYSLMLFGAWSATRRHDWRLLLMTGAPVLYVTGLTLASQISAMDTRMRTPISVPIIILAVYGLGVALERIGRKQTAANPATT